MIKLFYIANGSNDLFYPMNKNLIELKESITGKNNIEGYLIYKMIKCDPLNIWEQIEGEYKEEKSLIRYSKGTFEEIEDKEYYKEYMVNERRVSIIDTNKFLNNYMKEEDFNILIISGHGGPFQSLLDLENSPGISVNTLELISSFNFRNIELVFLDMCGMNYIEVMYEILYKRKVKRVITYKNLAPFHGIEAKGLLKYIENKNYEEEFKSLKEALIYLDTKMIKKMEKFRLKQNNVILEGIQKKERYFQRDIDVFRSRGINIGNETEAGKVFQGEILTFIKYRLNNEIEKEIYGMYKFLEKNLWNIVTRGKFNIEKEKIVDVIRIEEEGFFNIISIHNKNLNDSEIEKKLEKLIEIRKENDIY